MRQTLPHTGTGYLCEYGRRMLLEKHLDGARMARGWGRMARCVAMQATKSPQEPVKKRGSCAIETRSAAAVERARLQATTPLVPRCLVLEQVAAQPRCGILTLSSPRACLCRRAQSCDRRFSRGTFVEPEVKRCHFRPSAAPPKRPAGAACRLAHRTAASRLDRVKAL